MTYIINDKFVYICIKRALAEYNEFEILIKHPLSQQDCELYKYEEGIEKIDWETMEKVGATDEYSKNVKMAECITEKCIPAELFQCVYVPDEETKQYIEKLFLEKGITEHTPYVNQIGADKQLEGIATVLFLIREEKPQNKEALVERFKVWSEDKANRFSKEDILECIDYLEETSIISKDICDNYELTEDTL